jgi:Putative adhesin
MLQTPCATHLNKAPLTFALLMILAPWSHARAATSINEHRAASPQGSVEIINVAGSIEVQGWDRADVEVTGTVGKDVERVELTGEGDRTSIKVVLPEGRNWGSRTDGAAHLLVHVPANSSISTSLVSSDLKISAVSGDLKLQTVSGNLSGEAGGNVHANSVSGDVRLAAASAKSIEVQTVSGKIEVTGGNAETEISSVSGDATLSLGTVPRMRVKTVSGNLSASLAVGSEAQIEGESVSGDVTLDFAVMPAADFDIQTLSGRIDDCFGPKPTESRHGPGARLTFKSGETRANVRIVTKSGDVRMCVKGAPGDHTAKSP